MDQEHRNHKGCLVCLLKTSSDGIHVQNCKGVASFVYPDETPDRFLWSDLDMT